MATITAAVEIFDESYLAVQTAANPTRTTTFEQNVCTRTGTVQVFDEGYLALQSSSTPTRRSQTDAGYGGSGTLSIFGAGCIAPVGRKRE